MVSMSIQQEAQAIVQMCQGDPARALDVAERQLNTLHTRAQVLVSLAGVVVTVTGFSGRMIAGTHVAAQLLLVAGLATVIVSAVYVFLKVMTIRWVTSDLTEGPEAALQLALQRRESKTRAYAVGGVILFLGLVLYAGSIAIMLMNPHTAGLPVR
jgi:uncharacterized membrane protein YgdD (TMEM256/DUF423 family)